MRKEFNMQGERFAVEGENEQDFMTNFLAVVTHRSAAGQALGEYENMNMSGLRAESRRIWEDLNVQDVESEGVDSIATQVAAQLKSSLTGNSSICI